MAGMISKDIYPAQLYLYSSPRDDGELDYGFAFDLSDIPENIDGETIALFKWAGEGTFDVWRSFEQSDEQIKDAEDLASGKGSPE